MGVPEDEGTEFHDADKSGEVHDFVIWIPAIEYAGEVKEFGSLVDFSPETFLESFFCVFECCGFFNEVEVSEDANYFGEAMGLEDIEELECFLDQH